MEDVQELKLWGSQSLQPYIYWYPYYNWIFYYGYIKGVENKLKFGYENKEIDLPIENQSTN